MPSRFAALIAPSIHQWVCALAQHAEESRDVAPLPLTRLTWPGVVVIIILGLFVTAAIVGPLIRANTREDLD